MHSIDLVTFLTRFGLALALGAVMGLERQWHQRMAGTRTNALVATAAAVFSMVGLIIGGESSAGRVVGQIVSGVGFLGAGVIFKESGNIHGLNTAATVWCSAAVGTLSGIGFPQYAVVTALAVVLTNILFRPLAYVLQPQLKSDSVYHVEFTCAPPAETELRANLLAAVEQNRITLDALNSEDVDSGNHVRVTATLHTSRRNNTAVEQLVSGLSAHPGVSAASWRIVIPVIE